MSKGVLAVVSGFSGAGKGTIMKRLLEKYDDYVLSISVTTRNPREQEMEGVNYFFRSVEQFEQMIAQDAFLEHAQYGKNYYGTPKAYVEEQLESGKNVILEIETQGAMKIKEKMPATIMVFVTPPSAAELEARLRGRQTETEEEISRRLKEAAREATIMNCYDYILINDELEKCVDDLHHIFESERRKSVNVQEFIDTIQEETKKFDK